MAADVRSQFVGVWNLVSFERTSTDGKVTKPYGDKPVGRICYDKSGRMSAQLMRPGRRHTSLATANNSADSLRGASCDDLREMANGFASYYGTFDVDVASKTVIHHVKVAMLPSWVGTDLKRIYAVEGNRLSLTVVAASSRATLVWEKESDEP